MWERWPGLLCSAKQKRPLNRPRGEPDQGWRGQPGLGPQQRNKVLPTLTYTVTHPTCVSQSGTGPRGLSGRWRHSTPGVDLVSTTALQRGSRDQRKGGGRAWEVAGQGRRPCGRAGRGAPFGFWAFVDTPESGNSRGKKPLGSARTEGASGACWGAKFYCHHRRFSGSGSRWAKPPAKEATTETVISEPSSLSQPAQGSPDPRPPKREMLCSLKNAKPQGRNRGDTDK